jgi:ABC-type lipoprotein export system ATPase subunit
VSIEAQTLHRPAISFEAVNFAVGTRSLLNGVTFTANLGESVSITGPSGSGKSTLLSLALGLNKPSQGKVSIAGHDLGTLSRKNLARLRLHSVGMVFQAGELLDELTPVENVALAGLLAGRPRADVYAQAQRALDRLGIATDATVTGQLSGGERQRVAVARALINEPELVLADEPTGALDARASDAVASLLFSLPAEWGCSVVVVSHDMSVAARAAHRYELVDGGLRPQALHGATR